MAQAGGRRAAENQQSRGTRRPKSNKTAKSDSKSAKASQIKAAKATRARKTRQRATAPVEPRLPRYADLPIQPGAPAGSAWGVFGPDDQLGTVNLMTPARVRAAAGAIRTGRVFSLNLPITLPDPPLFGRGQHRHHIKQFAGHILDDYLDNFYPQASSQWDALAHVKHPRLGAYNGVPPEEMTGYGGVKLGIDNLARRGIAGRGVLADVARYHEAHDQTLDFTRNQSIPLEELQATLAAQKTRLRRGDVLLIRIGWTRAYLQMTPAERAALATRTRCPGIEGSRRTAQWLWDNHLAAVASDAPGLEPIPPLRPADPAAEADFLHFHMLSFFGMPIGEMWDLEELAADCASDRRYDFFLTSAPLNIPGGVGSPPNALAIK